MLPTDYRTVAQQRLATLGFSPTVAANATLRRAQADSLSDARLTSISLAFADPTLSQREAKEPSNDGDLVVTELLGEGGMGTVYLARQRALERDVAVKVPRCIANTYPEWALISEAKVVGSLEHPNIVPVHALAQDDSGRPVLVMKRVEGVSWADLLNNPHHPAWSREDLAGDDRLSTHLQILMHVANALAYAHDHGVIHRDVKPDNVMVGRFGEVYLLDWGVACRQGGKTRDEIVGTPVYMAPEMVSGSSAAADPRTDVYLLGATLHAVLTGRPRHDAEAIYDAMTLALESKPVHYSDDVPSELAALCNECTNREKDQRPTSATSFRSRIADYVRHRTSIFAAKAAQAILDQTDAQISQGTPIVAPQIAEALAECRYGFREALRTWSGNEKARVGLDECLKRMTARAIANNNPVTARALLDQVTGTVPELSTQIEALEDEQRRAREREAEAQRAAREMDRGLLALPRLTWLVVVFCGMLVGLVLSLRELSSGGPMPTRMALIVDGIAVAAVYLGVAMAGKRLLANEFNRRVVVMVIAVTTAVPLIDLAATLRGIDSASAATVNSLWLAAAFTIGAHNLERGWWRIVPIWLISAAVGLAFPRFANVAMEIAQISAVLVAFSVLKKSAQRRSQESSPQPSVRNPFAPS